MPVFSPAKLNIFLHVTGRRPDGYHELFTLMACVGVCDTLCFDFKTEGIAVRCAHPGVPEDETNLAHRAATLFMDRLSQYRPTGTAGVSITIDKKIPVGGGLGGGSSNAATVLTTLNHRFGMPFSRQGLMEMGLLLGADVPFFIQGKAALATGVGEQLTPCIVDPSVWVLLLLPGISASTAQVYKNINWGLTTGRKSNNNALIIAACEKGRILNFSEHLQGDVMRNDLEASACALYPEIGMFKAEAEDLLGCPVMMTGSGASFFAVFSSQKAAQEARTCLERQWQYDDGKNVCLTTFC